MGRSYRRYSRRSRAEGIVEAVGSSIGIGIALVIYAALSFGIDCIVGQFLLLVMGSYHITAGFWQAVFTVIVAEMIVGLGAYSGNKAGK